jgi:cephalosporin-C deacetylase
VFTDLPEAELRAYRSTVPDPDDFDAFWSEELTRSRAAAKPVRLTEVDTGLTEIRVHDVTFSGWNGQPIKGWLRVPAHAEGPLPGVVEYVGYGGGRGHAAANLLFAAAGFAHLQMDTRGQGSGWSRGHTADEVGTAGPQVPGVMTRGIRSKETYYYARFFTDAALAVDALRSLDLVDPERVGVTGGSQGGAAALAAGTLADGVRAVAARVPFLCEIPRAITITDANPFKEVANYLATHRDEVDTVLATLAYFDGVNFARRATAPALFSAALMDEIVPPSTVYAAYNAYPAPKDLLLWRFNGHEGGGPEDEVAALRFLAEHLAAG